MKLYVTFVMFCCLTEFTSLQGGVRIRKLYFLLLNQNIWCGYSKEPSQRDGSFEHPKHMFKLMDKKINAILRSKSWAFLYL